MHILSGQTPFQWPCNSNTSISSVLTIDRTLPLSLPPPSFSPCHVQTAPIARSLSAGWLASFLSHPLVSLPPSIPAFLSLSLSLNRFCPSPSPPSEPRYKADPSFPLSFSPAFFDVVRRLLAEDKEEMS